MSVWEGLLIVVFFFTSTFAFAVGVGLLAKWLLRPLTPRFGGYINGPKPRVEVGMVRYLADRPPRCWEQDGVPALVQAVRWYPSRQMVEYDLFDGTQHARTVGSLGVSYESMQEKYYPEALADLYDAVAREVAWKYDMKRRKQCK